MKIVWTLILVLFIRISSAQTNIYHQFPDSGVTWNFFETAPCWAPGQYTYDYSIVMDGDTLINGMLYHKLSTPCKIQNTLGMCFPAVGDSVIAVGYVGAIREDTVSRKVYYFDGGVERLLYDFNMQIGDTVQGLMYSFGSTTDTVISIDSILIGSSYHKRWHINSCYGVWLIEGIGSTHGLVRQLPGCQLNGPHASLVCVNQNGNVIYQTSGGPCETITSLKEEGSNTTYKVFPNPSASDFTVEFDNADMHILEILDLSGKRIHIYQLNSSNSFHVPALTAGSYILRFIRNDGKIINSRFISVSTIFNE